MALNCGASSDFLGLSAGIQEFGIVVELFVGHAPELRLEFAMKFVAYTLIEKASMNLEFSKTC